jgi:hypothetical protein
LSFNEIKEADYESRLLGHTKIESTVRYLGIEVDDALAIAEQVDVIPGQSEHALPVLISGHVPRPIRRQSIGNIDRQPRRNFPLWVSAPE